MYNTKFINVVNSLRLENPVTDISTALKTSKGSVSSYLGGKVKASKPFLKKFADYYKLSLIDIIDLQTNANTGKSVIGDLSDDKVVDYIIEHADRLRSSNYKFNMFCELLEVKAQRDIMQKLRE